MRDHHKTVQLLIDAGAAVDARRTDDGWTPLMLCSQNGHAGCVRMLLDAAAQPNLSKGNGWTPLMAAAQNGHTLCAQLLLAADANPEIVRVDGATALSLSEERGHYDASRLLRTHLGRPTDDTDYYKGTRESYPDPRRGGQRAGPMATRARAKWGRLGLASKVK